MKTAVCLVAFAALGLAADHPDLNGVWKIPGTGETLSIQQTDDSVKIAESGKESTQIQCNTVGQACKIKGGEVTMWYNGAMLVLLESTHGSSHVVKKRLKVSDDGKSLEEEIIHIAPAGGSEKVSLSRESHS
jgi:hypothetical protein